eukprot:CAMPEP_0114226374 /NCGR_PEP_ID=MMETSP0058-20121206/1201_1 /TAXON_ID=36894 /ORGANISM="Pyramimonas parkeae, CCMP726" /LENGTH=98 /DNA_ID=CAMNT_0001337101 /DNA_START=498 /DNA_END=790 /DNA_ORIENTATION=+
MARNLVLPRRANRKGDCTKNSQTVTHNSPLATPVLKRVSGSLADDMDTGTSNVSLFTARVTLSTSRTRDISLQGRKQGWPPFAVSAFPDRWAPILCQP